MYLRDRLSASWILLAALTLSSFSVFESRFLGPLSGLIVMSIAGGKVWVIMREFMEIDRAPLIWQRMYKTWIVVVLAVIIVGNYAAVAFG